jgi:hypothetical protein
VGPLTDTSGVFFIFNAWGDRPSKVLKKDWGRGEGTIPRFLLPVQIDPGLGGETQWQKLQPNTYNCFDQLAPPFGGVLGQCGPSGGKS